MPDPTLDFYFDFISHNAYLAWHEIKPLCDEHGVTLNPVPVLFAGLLAEHKQLGPAEIEPKNRWMIIDVLRKARLLGLPLNPPESHPFNPLLCLRIAIAAKATASCYEIIDQLFAAVWADSQDVTDPQILIKATGTDGVAGETLLAEASSDAVKAALRANTENALARGVFGVPSMMLGERLFWGYDDLRFLRMHLQGEDPLDENELARWNNIRSTASRA